jgi:hypothetical protein
VDRSGLETAAEGMTESAHSLLGPEWFLVWVTIGLVIVTAALAVFTAYLYRTTKTLAIGLALLPPLMNWRPQLLRKLM